MTKTSKIVAAVSALMLTPAPAMAEDSMSTLETVGVFVLLPITIYGVIWVLWSIPAWRRDVLAPRTGDAWSPKPAK